MIVLCALAIVAGCAGEDDISLGELSAPAEAEASSESSETAAAPQQEEAPERPTAVRRPSRPGDGEAVGSLWERAAEGAKTEGAVPENPPSQIQFISPQRLKAAGLRKIDGKHLILVTDLPPSPAVDGMPAVFDLAVPKWVNYFGLDAAAWQHWQMTGYLMKDTARFQSLNLILPDLPAFKNGYTLGNEFWMYDQKSDYYRRHLALHEGVHGLMFTAYGTQGPAWHLEGMAELLATHLWRDGQLTLPYYPRDKSEVPLLGRIRIVKDEIAAGRALRLENVLNYGSRDHRRNEPYGWCWAACAFLDGHPRYQARFRDLCQQSSGANFNGHFQKAFADDWTELSEEWLVFVAGIEHAHDIARCAIDYQPGQPLPAEGLRVTVASDRGWQSAGVHLQAGQRYQISAEGRYKIAKDQQDRIWWCEPGGVTIRYYGGAPLGKLVAAVRPNAPAKGQIPALLRIRVIGRQAIIAPTESGTLYLRVNDSAGELADNQGTLEVDIRTFQENKLSSRRSVGAASSPD